MLDEMSESDPKEYEKFVEKAQKEGREEIQKEKEKEKEEKGIQSEPVMCVKLKLTQLSTKKEENKDKEFEMRLFDYIHNREWDEDDIKTYLESPLVFLNICKSDKVLGPLTEDFAKSDDSNYLSWKWIPVSFEKEVWNDDLIIFDAHINSKVIEKALSDK